MEYIIRVKDRDELIREFVHISEEVPTDYELRKLFRNMITTYTNYTHYTIDIEAVECAKEIPLHVFSYSPKWYSFGYTPSFTKCPNCNQSIGYHPKDVRCWNCAQKIIWN